MKKIALFIIVCALFIVPNLFAGDINFKVKFCDKNNDNDIILKNISKVEVRYDMPGKPDPDIAFGILDSNGDLKASPEYSQNVSLPDNAINIVFDIYPQNEQFVCYNGLSSDSPLYCITSPTYTISDLNNTINFSLGDNIFYKEQNNIAYTFYQLQRTYEILDTATREVGQIVNFPKTKVYLNVTDSYLRLATQEIALKSRVVGDEFWRDLYKTGSHEVAHAFKYAKYMNAPDSSKGHSKYTISHYNIALEEGWAEFMESYCFGKFVFKNPFYPELEAWTGDVESNTLYSGSWGLYNNADYNLKDFTALDNCGGAIEGVAMNILWDLFDSSNDNRVNYKDTDNDGFSDFNGYVIDSIFNGNINTLADLYTYLLNNYPAKAEDLRILYEKNGCIYHRAKLNKESNILSDSIVEINITEGKNYSTESLPFFQLPFLGFFAQAKQAGAILSESGLVDNRWRIQIFQDELSEGNINTVWNQLNSELYNPLKWYPGQDTGFTQNPDAVTINFNTHFFTKDTNGDGIIDFNEKLALEGKKYAVRMQSKRENDSVDHFYPDYDGESNTPTSLSEGKTTAQVLNEMGVIRICQIDNFLPRIIFKTA